MNEYWKAHIFDEGIFGVKFDDCHSVGWDIEGLCPDCEKYMYLIAAAPDLLEALEAALPLIVDAWQYRTGGTEVITLMKAAIAKARGEQ